VSLLLWLDARQEQYPFYGLQRWVWCQYYTIDDIWTLFFQDDTVAATGATVAATGATVAATGATGKEE
jgi:hypothetical protein